ncbi:MAG: hypothetical protein OEL89_02345, partial [Candidatus Peregrinibacteria bacterium]|nr:hypothetical protein [Candidatus Peregrinibacteria bacterium]
MNNLNVLKKFGLPLAIVGWAVFVCYSFLGSHSMYWEILNKTSEFFRNFSSVVALFVVLLFTSVGFFVYFRDRLSGGKILMLFLLSTLFAFLFFGAKQDLFKEVSFFEAGLRILWTLFLCGVGASVFTVFLVGVGQMVCEKVFREKDSSFAENFYFGFLVLSFLGFVLSKVGLFNGGVFAVAGLFLVVFFYKNFFKIFRKVFSWNNQGEFVPTNIEIFLGAIFVAVMSLNFLQSFLPFSLGWDSATQYLVTIKLLAEEGVLRTGLFPPFTEIVMAVGATAGGISFVQFLFNFWAVLVFGIVLDFGKRMAPKVSRMTNSFLVLALFLIPAIQFQLSRDLKLDVLFLGTVLTALVLWDKGKLKMSASLLGFAVLQKLTAVLMFPAFVVLLFLKKGVSLQYKMLTLVCLVIPFGIWASVNMIEVGSVPRNFATAKEVFSKGKKVMPKVDFSQTPIVLGAKAEKIEVPVSTGYKEEVSRYSGFETGVYKKIWAVLTSPEIPDKNKQYVDLGFFFIFVLPLFAVFWKKVFTLPVFWFGISFFFLWIYLGNGVAWYGVPAITILLFCAARVVRDDRILNGVFVVGLSVSILLGLVSRLEHFVPSPANTAISWAIAPKAERIG